MFKLFNLWRRFTQFSFNKLIDFKANLLQIIRIYKDACNSFQKIQRDMTN